MRFNVWRYWHGQDYNYYFSVHEDDTDMQVGPMTKAELQKLHDDLGSVWADIENYLEKAK